MKRIGRKERTNRVATLRKNNRGEKRRRKNARTKDEEKNRDLPRTRGEGNTDGRRGERDAEKTRGTRAEKKKRESPRARGEIDVERGRGRCRKCDKGHLPPSLSPLLSAGEIIIDFLTPDPHYKTEPKTPRRTSPAKGKNY